MAKSSVLMSEAQMAEAIAGLTHEIMNRHKGCEDVALVGIQRRGAGLAKRIGAILQKETGRAIPIGSLNITLYRDDWTNAGPKPLVGASHLPFPIEGKTLALIDDVVFTGRTIRAALEALSDYGRPRKVELFALVDRGHRELPIHPDYAALTLETRKEDKVDVRLHEYDDKEGVFLVTPR